MSIHALVFILPINLPLPNESVPLEPKHFQLDGERQDGPPFSVSLEAYRQALKEDEWEKVLDEAHPDLPDNLTGRARVVLWRSLKKD